MFDDYSFDIGDIADEISNIDWNSLSPDILNDISGLDYSQFNLDSDLFGDAGIDDIAAALQNDPGSVDEILSNLPSGYQDIYGGVEAVLPGETEYSPEQIAEMERQDQLYSMGQEGLKSVFSDDTEPGSSGGTQGSQGPAGPGAIGSYKGASYLPGGAKIDSKGNVKLPDGKTVTPGGKVSSGKSLLETLMPLLLAALVTKRKGSGINTQPVLPKLTAEQRQTPYTQMQQAPGYRPGQGGVRYFEPLTYTQRMAGGGIIDLAKALAAKRREQRKGLLQGRGDGVSDSIPATIDGKRPARLARGEYVVDARTVAELGNGSTDAGAERLDEMRKRVLQKRKKAKVGQDSKARQDLPE